jgi:signal transduction histidine kinase
MSVQTLEGELLALRAHVQRLQADVAAARSERRDAEELARAKDEFLAMVAHELRAPLAAIVGWANMLREPGKQADVDTGLAVIEQSAQVQMKLIEDLLVMTRMGGNPIVLHCELLDPRHVIDAVIDSLVPAAAEKELRITKRYDSRAQPVRGDATRLQQVMTNLLTNALKFTPRRGAIEVTLKRSRGWAVIGVSDSGAGIAPQFLPHVFDRYRQDPATARSHGGLGLGLAIARHLVDLHGGEIEAHSAGEGQGATFVVRLPLAETRQEPAAFR